MSTGLDSCRPAIEASKMGCVRRAAIFVIAFGLAAAARTLRRWPSTRSCSGSSSRRSSSRTRLFRTTSPDSSTASALSFRRIRVGRSASPERSRAPVCTWATTQEVEVESRLLVGARAVRRLTAALPRRECGGSASGWGWGKRVNRSHVPNGVRCVHWPCIQSRPKARKPPTRYAREARSLRRRSLTAGPTLAGSTGYTRSAFLEAVYEAMGRKDESQPGPLSSDNQVRLRRRRGWVGDERERGGSLERSAG